jgi:hypothetical protein
VWKGFTDCSEGGVGAGFGGVRPDADYLAGSRGLLSLGWLWFLGWELGLLVFGRSAGRLSLRGLRWPSRGVERLWLLLRGNRRFCSFR